MRRRRAKSATLEPTNSNRDKTSARIVQRTGSPIREVNRNAKNVAAQQLRKRAKRFVQSAMLERSCSRKRKLVSGVPVGGSAPTQRTNVHSATLDTTAMVLTRHPVSAVLRERTNLRKDKTSARIAQQTGSPTREVNRNAKNVAVQQPRRQAKHFVQNVKQEHSCLRKKRSVLDVLVVLSARTERKSVHSASLDTTATVRTRRFA